MSIHVIPYKVLVDMYYMATINLIGQLWVASPIRIHTYIVCGLLDNESPSGLLSNNIQHQIS